AIHLQTPDMLLDNPTEFQLPGVLVKERPLERRLRYETQIHRQAPSLGCVEMREDAKTGVLPAQSRNICSEQDSPQADLIGETGRPFRTYMQLMELRRYRSLELGPTIHDIVHVRLVGERPQRKRFVFKYNNLKRILCIRSKAQQWQ